MIQRKPLRPDNHMTASGTINRDTTGVTGTITKDTTGVTGAIIKDNAAVSRTTVQVFLTAVEAAALLRLSPITLSRWRVQGYGPRWTKMGPKRVCYSLDDLTAFTDAQKRTSTSDL